MRDPKQFLMYLLFSALFLLGVVFFFPNADEPDESEGAAQAVPHHQTITSGEARVLMESGEPYILLDVRTVAEFERSHIPGATLFPYDEIVIRALAELQDQEARILLYCQTGRRSANAARALAELGFTNVYDFGGIASWPYETVSG